jgi:hypothetical protein
MSKPDKRVYMFVGILFLGLIGFTLIRVRSQEPSSQDNSEFVKAIRKGGLREAARIRGHYVATMNTSYWLKFDLESLTKNSAAIIVGTPEGSASRLSPDGQQITTEYQIKVKKSLKGGLTPNEIMSVSLPGGKIVFEDGTSAEIKTPDLEGMENGSTYVLFISPKVTALGALTLTGGAQGLFELSNDKQGVRPHGHRVDSVQKHKGQSIEGFLGEIETAVKKYPEISTCCR